MLADNSYKGNAYGLANTLFQTAILKPSIKPGKVNNLYFAGQLTSPGPGVPPSIISGQVREPLKMNCTLATEVTMDRMRTVLCAGGG